jgi:hypothetical protein
MVPLSSLTKTRVSEVFRADEVKAAADLLEAECGDNLPFMQGATAEELERIRLAVLRVSQGEMVRLESACKVAKVDWREVLVAAGFGQDAGAHLSWVPKRRT